MSLPTSFTISIAEDEISALRSKLATVRWPDELEDAKWDYGVPLSDMKRLVSKWTEYDWKAHEKHINDALPQFTQDVEIEGHGTVNVHYVHKTSDVKNAIPLLFVHGWPGSFIEVLKILPLLTASPTDSKYPSFHVVAPSLPGFGFSQAPLKSGFNDVKYAETCHKLMLSLGYTEYVTQGGDWGYSITRRIAQLYGGKHSKAWHTNFPMSRPPQLYKNPAIFLKHLITPYTEAERAGLTRTAWFSQNGRGYFYEQSTQPQTLGYSLADSPVGLLAWIYEKLVNWTDNYAWTDDEVLTWMSIYWFSRAGPAASVRIYYETVQSGSRENIFEVNPTIPMGASYFPKELSVLPRTWVYGTGNVVFTREHPRGGHFAAHEEPELLVGDLRDMFGVGGPAFEVVKGKNGYDRL